jgi:Tol biopolymer transport system component
VTVAFDQSQVVVMNADGAGMRVASPNQQIILSNVAWSADGRRIAYTMSTLPHASGVDLFMTDLETDRVTRLTTGAGLGVPGVEMAWAAGGGQLFVSRVTGEGGAPLFEYGSSVTRLDVGSLQQTPIATGIAGEIAAIAQGGEYLVIVRRTSPSSSGYLEHIVRRNLASGGESALTEDALLAWASLTAGERSILYTVATPGTADVLNYFLLPAGGGAAQRLGAIDVQVTSADVRPE